MDHPSGAWVPGRKMLRLRQKLHSSWYFLFVFRRSEKASLLPAEGLDTVHAARKVSTRASIHELRCSP
jgi:hypothetical protein